MGKYKLCFRKLDLKTKKVTFHATIVSHTSEDTASLQTVDLIVKDLEKLQQRIDTISMNVQLQQEVDKDHADSNNTMNNMI